MLTQVLPTGSYSDELVHAILNEKLNQNIVAKMIHAVARSTHKGLEFKKPA